MPYGEIRVDTITFTNGGVDKSITVSGLFASTSGNLTVTGTVSGTTANFASGVFTTQISGATITGTTVAATTGTFTTVTGGVATITSGVFAAGSAAAPSISFSSDPNTGIYSPGGDQVAISTNGTGRLFVDASGNVGVGINSLGNAFVVYRGASASAYAEFVGNNAPASSLLIGQDATGLSRIFQNGNNPLTVWTNGSEKLRVTGGGLVGIGTSAPAAQVDSTPADGGNAYAVRNWPIIRNTSTTLDIGGYSSSQWTATRLYTNGSIAMTIDSSQRVGIGTTSVQAILHASKSGAEGFEFNPGYEANRNLIFHYNRTGANYVVNDQAASQHVFRINSISTEAVRIDASSRLLVGTSTARANFTKVQIEDTGSSASASITANTTNTAQAPRFVLARSNGTSVGSTTIVENNNLLGSYDFRGADGTNFVVGAEIAAYVDGTPGANDMPGRIVLSTTASGASSPTERCRITNAGHFYVGTTSNGGQGGFTVVPNASNGAMQVSIDRASTTNSSFPFLFNNGGVLVGSINYNNTSTTFATSSDYRLKENVTVLTDGIARLQQLRPSRFNFIQSPSKTVDGFIAHEVQSVVPEAITGEKDAVDDDGNPVYQGIDQSKLVPLLTAALQEAVARIEQLETAVATIQGQ